MPRRRSNIGRRTRQAIKERQRRLNRTDQERLAHNERDKARIYKKRTEELAEQREERLKYLRVQAKRRRAANSSRRRQRERDERLKQIQMQYLNDQASCEIDFPFEPDDQYNASFEFDQIEKLEIEVEPLGMCCARGKVKLPEYKKPGEPVNNLLNKDR